MPYHESTQPDEYQGLMENRYETMLALFGRLSEVAESRPILPLRLPISILQVINLQNAGNTL